MVFYCGRQELASTRETDETRHRGDMRTDARMRQIHKGHRQSNAADRLESRSRQFRHRLRQESTGPAEERAPEDNARRAFHGRGRHHAGILAEGEVLHRRPDRRHDELHKGFPRKLHFVALVVDGTAELGAIYNPYLDEMFTAMRGQGAFCNGKRIHVSSEPLENGLVIFGTSPYNEELSERSFKLAYSYFKKSIDIRRTGSAALDMCSVAAGRAELFFELSLSPWDYAAGALIVEEAGGIVTDIDGNALVYGRKSSVLARNNVARPIE